MREVVVYKVPPAIQEHVRAAFEERGVRLLPDDRIVVRDGEDPVVMRRLDRAIIPYLSSLPVAKVEPGQRGGPHRRSSDPPLHLRLVRDQPA